MKRAITLLAFAALAGSAMADGFDAQILRSYNLGETATAGVDAADPNAAYSNVTNFVGSAVRNTGGTASAPTFMIADDCTTTIGGAVTTLRFSMANLNTASKSIKPSIRIYADNAGAPGTLLYAVDFNAVTLAASSVSVLTFTPGTTLFTAAANTQYWIGEFFTGGTGTTSTTAAQVNNWAMGLFNPPDVGTSSFNEWDSAAGNTQLTNNPTGALYTGGYSSGTIPANYGFELVVPAPSSVALLGLGGLIASRRRRA
jgi:hypothetical protein